MNALLSKLREQDKELKRTTFHVARNREISLPEGYTLERKNISRVWHLESAPPFKVFRQYSQSTRKKHWFQEFNMVEVMETWQRPRRAHKHDHFLLVLDFLRHFFLNVSDR